MKTSLFDSDSAWEKGDEGKITLDYFRWGTVVRLNLKDV